MKKVAFIIFLQIFPNFLRLAVGESDRFRIKIKRTIAGVLGTTWQQKKELVSLPVGGIVQDSTRLFERLFIMGVATVGKPWAFGGQQRA